MDGARARTPAALGTPSDRGSPATGLPRSARPAGFAALALAALALAGCSPYVQGNGVYREEDRTPATTFTGLHVDDGIEATVTSGAAQQKVVVSGDANIVKDYLKTEIVTDQGTGPVLHVWIDVSGGSWSSSIPPRAVVSLGELRYVKAESDSHVSASRVATPLLTLEAHDKSSLFVMGAGGARVEAVASDAVVDAGSYPLSEGALVTLSEGARAEVHADGPVAGSVGAGCTLQNFGSGACGDVTVDPGATVLCPVP